MQNLGTVGAIASALLLLGNMLTTPMLMPLGWRIIGLLTAGVLSLIAFLYCGHRYSPTVGWIASGAVFSICLLLLGMI